jgi:hypothetical protein
MLKKYQYDANKWALECFGTAVATDLQERRQRFLEEAVELCQASGADKEEVNKLVDYVFSRPIGDRFQEVGGVMVTLAVLGDSINIDLQDAAECELKRVQGRIDRIRIKHQTKPLSIRTDNPIEV